MTDPRHITFEAIDSLMFRDGRPFNQSDEAASRAVSVFPPYPPTIVGAVRAALWQQKGGEWPKDGSLGDGTDWRDEKTLGPRLSFGAPILLKNKNPVFPVPRHVVEGENDHGDKICVWLAPGPARNCDLGPAVKLPIAQEKLKGIKAIEDRWVTLEGMKNILQGRLPAENQFVKVKDLWREEPRVGIGLDVDTRATIKSQLYMASHVRMKSDILLGVEMMGWQGKPLMALQPLAGEHRMAQIAEAEIRWSLPQPPKIKGKTYCIILLSPLVLNSRPEPGKRLENLPGRLISACLGKPVSIGGWDSKKKGPIPLRKAIPAGSVFFMQLDDGETAPGKNGGMGVGETWGFGQYLISAWQGSKSK